MVRANERVAASRETGKNVEQVKEAAADNVVLRWENFLSKMEMRVLLVEADNCTRHIISALLKNCYYTVDAFSDGLKAWQRLNSKPHNIDLILTEVEVPSISGFSLLSLVAEHEVYRNIPVIMMSGQDSVGTVYNCMLKGAADFLVKPIRKNELNNLWQHVWRRQASSSGQAQTASDEQKMVKVVAEKDTTRDYSSSYKACSIENDRECIQKGSDSQSSGSLQYLGTKKACREQKYDITQQKQRKPPSSDAILQKDDLEKGSERALIHDAKTQGSTSVPKTNFEVPMLREDIGADRGCETAIETFDYNNNIVRDKSPREAIDLIGTLNTYPECSYRSLDSTNDFNMLDSSLTLELSLNLSHPKGSLNHDRDDGHVLKQSEVSAFSRHNGGTLPPLHKSSDGICDQRRDYEINFDKRLTHQAHESSHHDNTISPTSDGSGIQFPRSLQEIPVNGPAKCASSERAFNVHNNLAPPSFFTQSSQSPLQSPDTPGNHEQSIEGEKNCSVNPGIRGSQKTRQYLMDQNGYSASPPMESNKSHEVELSKDGVHLASVNNQHASGGSCNSISNGFEIINNGSNGTSRAFELFKVSAKGGIEASLIYDDKLNRSILRKAALIKYRMKRKNRCFAKKVRYQSRSKRAALRARVKGQFVRGLKL